MNDTLRDLIQSTADFYARFDYRPPFEAVLRVFQEEVGELIEAVESGQDKDHMAEEAADVFVTAIGLCLTAGVEPEAIIRQTRMVIDKNNAKTHDTHHIDANGKIARR